jgi:hypothetical protein
VLLHTLLHGIRKAIVDFETSFAKFGCEAPHGGDDEVGSLNVPAAGRNF